MTGGTYHSHVEMELLLGYGAAGLTATTDPTDAELDEITKIVEAVAGARIRGQTGRTLSDANGQSTSETLGCLLSLSQKLFLVQRRAKMKESSVSSADGTSKSSTSSMSWEPELSTLVALAGAGGKSFRTVAEIDRTNYQSS